MSTTGPENALLVEYLLDMAPRSNSHYRSLTSMLPVLADLGIGSSHARRKFVALINSKGGVVTSQSCSRRGEMPVAGSAFGTASFSQHRRQRHPQVRADREGSVVAGDWDRSGEPIASQTGAARLSAGTRREEDGPLRR